VSISEHLHGEAVIDAHSKLAGGIYLISIELHADRVSCSIYTSRPIPVGELRERLSLRDSVGTEYAMQPNAEDVIDGKGIVEFAPSLPTDATNLTLGVPGSWFTAYAFHEPAPTE
jgi:hypothetical protein